MPEVEDESAEYLPMRPCRTAPLSRPYSHGSKAISRPACSRKAVVADSRKAIAAGLSPATRPCQRDLLAL
eukprot:11725531-Alexandrium_andersonii.AAC.1